MWREKNVVYSKMQLHVYYVVKILLYNVIIFIVGRAG